MTTENLALLNAWNDIAQGKILHNQSVWIAKTGRCLLGWAMTREAEALGLGHKIEDVVNQHEAFYPVLRDISRALDLHDVQEVKDFSRARYGISLRDAHELYAGGTSLERQYQIMKAYYGARVLKPECFDTLEAQFSAAVTAIAFNKTPRELRLSSDHLLRSFQISLEQVPAHAHGLNA